MARGLAPRLAQNPDRGVCSQANEPNLGRKQIKSISQHAVL
jgi:hypothetical protein